MRDPQLLAAFMSERNNGYARSANETLSDARPQSNGLTAEQKLPPNVASLVMGAQRRKA
jgi:hypothetical protein